MLGAAYAGFPGTSPVKLQRSDPQKPECVGGGGRLNRLWAAQVEQEIEKTKDRDATKYCSQQPAKKMDAFR
jgi:hypothetical protein